MSAISAPVARSTKVSTRASRTVQPTGPSSLVKATVADRGTCPDCGGHQLMDIGMTLTDGSAVRFTSCRSCEYRAWTDSTGLVAVADVLERARKHK